jgi:hypothetical protein
MTRSGSMVLIVSYDSFPVFGALACRDSFVVHGSLHLTDLFACIGAARVL